MNKSMIFTVQMPENDKPIVYAREVNDKYKNDQVLAEAIIGDWMDENDVPDPTPEELKELAYNMRHDGYAWWDETICFELTEVYG